MNETPIENLPELLRADHGNDQVHIVRLAVQTQGANEMTIERRQYTPEQIAWVEAAENQDERSRREDQLKANYTEPGKLTPEEKLVLNELAYVSEEYALYFRGIQNSTNLDRKQVRKACRSLAAKGFAEYRRGLCNEDDGMLAGSGYSVTVKGALFAKNLVLSDAISTTDIDNAI